MRFFCHDKLASCSWLPDASRRILKVVHGCQTEDTALPFPFACLTYPAVVRWKCFSDAVIQILMVHFLLSHGIAVYTQVLFFAAQNRANIVKIHVGYCTHTPNGLDWWQRNARTGDQDMAVVPRLTSARSVLCLAGDGSAAAPPWSPWHDLVGQVDFKNIMATEQGQGGKIWGNTSSVRKHGTQINHGLNHYGWVSTPSQCPRLSTACLLPRSPSAVAHFRSPGHKLVGK